MRWLAQEYPQLVDGYDAAVRAASTRQASTATR